MHSLILMRVPFVLLLLGLSACAQAARVEQMTVTTFASEATAASPDLAGAITLDSVLGGDTTNPMWTSEVGNAEFKSALLQSLSIAGFLAPDSAASRYGLLANLHAVEQPIMGFDMTVKSVVQYQLTSRESGETVMNETISAPYTATMGQAFIGVERLRIANEGAIKENIRRFLAKLAALEL